nr:DNA replication complex GINS protein PSF2-like [Quercus suber]
MTSKASAPRRLFKPPFPAPLPLWLALLLKRQKRANISPPPWLRAENLTAILEMETDDSTAGVFSPGPDLPPAVTGSTGEDAYLALDALELSTPFLPDEATARAQADALPYHWLELGHLLLTHAPDDFEDPDTVRRLLRDVREVRMSKLRKGFKVLDAGAGVKLNGVGGMEIAEVRGYVVGVVDGLRKINRSREEARKERELEERENGLGGDRRQGYDDNDDDMQL